MNEYTEIMEKATLSQISDFVKNGEASDIDAILSHEQGNFHSLGSWEKVIQSKLEQEDADSLIDEIYNCMFRIENIAFQNGIRVGSRLLKELLQI